MDWLDKMIEKCGFFSFLYKNKKTLVLFGAGKIATETIKYLENKHPEMEIAYIIDNNVEKSGTDLMGIPVISYEEFLQKDSSDIKVLLTSKNMFQLYQDLKHGRIADKDMYFPNSTWVMKESFMSADWVTGIFVYVRMLDIYFNKDKIREVCECLADKESKEVLKAVIKFRLTLEPKHITNVCACTNSDYFSKAPFALSKEEVLVDAGALRGDSTLEFLCHVKDEFEHVYLIEPDAVGLCKAMDSIFSLENRDKISYYHLACSDVNGLDTIWSGTVSRVMKLDDLLEGKKVTIIKMDIEGMEKKALIGAAKIISRENPKLCICVYHKSSDLWELPLFIKQMNPLYKIYLRQESPGVYGDVQTVCYAYDEE